MQVRLKTGHVANEEYLDILYKYKAKIRRIERWDEYSDNLEIIIECKDDVWEKLLAELSETYSYLNATMLPLE